MWSGGVRNVFDVSIRFLKFKDGKTIPDTMISCYDRGQDNLLVEFWNVRKSYHDLKPAQNEEQGIYSKYSNKRKWFTRDQLNEIFI